MSGSCEDQRYSAGNGSNCSVQVEFLCVLFLLWCPGVKPEFDILVSSTGGPHVDVEEQSVRWKQPDTLTTRSSWLAFRSQMCWSRQRCLQCQLRCFMRKPVCKSPSYMFCCDLRLQTGVHCILPVRRSIIRFLLRPTCRVTRWSRGLSRFSRF